jgi:hypothetical protein
VRGKLPVCIDCALLLRVTPAPGHNRVAAAWSAAGGAGWEKPDERFVATMIKLQAILAGGRARHSFAVPARPIDKGLLISRPLGMFYLLTARTSLLIFGCAAVAWGMYTLPLFARQVPIERVATHVLEGDPFKSGVLAALMPQVDAAERTEPCSPAVTHGAAIIRTRMAEQAVVDGDDIDARLNALRDSIRRSLACSPADPFLWVVLYWVEINRNGFQPGYLEYLRLSYQLGPNEGWIAIKRNGYALAIFHQLPPDVADRALAEFPRLLDSGFDAEAFKIFTGPGWSHRALLLPHLKGVAEIHREALARSLYRAGYDVIVPGITRPDPRPWD